MCLAEINWAPGLTRASMCANNFLSLGYLGIIKTASNLSYTPMTKSRLLIIIALLIGILFLGRDFYLPSSSYVAIAPEPGTQTNESGSEQFSDNQLTSSENGDISSIENSTGLTITSPKANQEISSPLKISGSINGQGWTAFEAQAGTVDLLDAGKKTIASGVLSTTSEWTTLPTNFETSIAFSAAAGQGSLVFRNENPSGNPEMNKAFSLPVRIAANAATGRMNVNIFFSSNDNDSTCEKVLAVQREISKSAAPARAALEELLKGPSEQEKSKNFFTSINENVKIKRLSITNGVAEVDLSEELSANVGGSCRVSAIRAQITQTLKQFPTVREVVISIDGNTEGILQP